jgi:HEPN domain-containing protein
MKPLTGEWVKKAEGDFTSAQREFRARKAPNYDAACFHAQQCAEKYLKAILQEQDIVFGKTHNLPALLELILPTDPSWEMLRLHLQALNTFAVDIRYPGEFANFDTHGNSRP